MFRDLFDDDDEILSKGGGMNAKDDYMREMAKKGLTHQISCGDWKKYDKTPDEIRHANATYSPSKLDEELLVAQKRQSPGKNFERYFDLPVEIIGHNISEGMVAGNFEQAFWKPVLLRNIKWMGYEKPTPIQKYAMPYIISLRDMIACSPTGSGKTAAYILPILHYILVRGDVNWSHSTHPALAAIVIVPTRELADQVRDEARVYARDTKIQVVSVYGGTNLRAQVEYIRKKGCNILIGTPGRLLQIISEGRFHLGKCKFIVLDEAHQLSGTAQDELSVRQILQFPDLPPPWRERHTLIFSATFSKEMEEFAEEFLRYFVFVGVGKIGGANEDIVQGILHIPKSDKFDKLSALIKEDFERNASAGNQNETKTLIFVERKQTAEFIASRLSQIGLPAKSIHGDREQREREEALHDFKAGRCPVLVATGVAARGLDIVAVDHVINFDLPLTVDEYVHRIGRTGRVGNPGRATSFYDPQTDKNISGPLINVLKDAQQPVPDWLLEEFCASGGK